MDDRFINILVVEDNDINRKLLGSMLKTFGHRFTLANDGMEAVAAVAAPADRHLHLSQAYRICHDIKGQAATFGWDLVSLIARPLCLYIERLENASEGDFTVMRKHLALMQVVVEQQVKGTAEPLASKITAKLEEIAPTALV